MADVVMKDSLPPPTPATTESVPQGSESSSILLADLKKNLVLIEKSVNSKETRFLSRVLRQTSNIRKRINAHTLHQLITLTFADPSLANSKASLLSYLGNDAMETESSTPLQSDGAKIPHPTSLLPEVEVYVSLLLLIFLIDQKRFEDSAKLSTNLVEKVMNLNRASLNLLTAKVFFYYSFAHELVGRFASIRPTLLAAYRTASLRHNDEGQATILNLLLRNYLEHSLYDQADKLVSKTVLKEQSCSSNQYARYLYYQGRIKAVQLDYTEAYRYLNQATRKAPQLQSSAKGFRQTVHKFLCIVQLLMGEMPDIGIFRQPSLKKALKPYFELTQAVRIGHLETFRNVVETFGDIFRKDQTFTLIQRLRHNVIKTGLRKINVSYSKISIKDICAKLRLDCGQEDAEYIVAKAIKDGVIDATIDHQGGYIQSKENTDIYSTTEPHSAFHTRVRFCLEVHNEAVRAMRFPEDQHRRLAQDQAENARKERVLQDELQKELDDDEADEF
eukprot:TRINITY_DN7190_c0_g3_i2.p1 TRINITY_DN7190_c0_g3~~TRINITY_DN7190_c0_g3_i2.p1  ORF type:complete len:503 (+),score=98.12 TRINITY_DN7190_c0_g3_i2:269-1777(+)